MTASSRCSVKPWAIDLFIYLADVDTQLEMCIRSGSALPRLTQSVDWARAVLKSEVAMFSVSGQLGAEFSQEIGDLRRALESVEGAQCTNPAVFQPAVQALRRLTDHLADWLMQGRHRDPKRPTASS